MKITMQTAIKAGQIWETRSARRIRIDEVLPDNGTTPVNSGDRYWQLNGRYWADDVDHPKDLIKLIE